MIPQSPILTEELPPEGTTLAEAIQRFDQAIVQGTHQTPGARGDLKVIIAAARKMRERWQEVERQTGGKAPSRVERVPLGKKLSGSLEDLGL